MTRAEAEARVIAAARRVIDVHVDFDCADTITIHGLTDALRALDACPKEETVGVNLNADISRLPRWADGIPRDLYDARALAWAAGVDLADERDHSDDLRGWDLAAIGNGWWPTRDAEIARLRADNVALRDRGDELAAEAASAITACETLRAQLVAAQANAVALRVALARIAEAEFGYSRSVSITSLQGVLRIAREALATPAPGAPLLDAVRGLVAAAERIPLSADCTWREQRAGHDWPEALDALAAALAAVRAVLSRAQDTAGVSRGEDVS